MSLSLKKSLAFMLVSSVYISASGVQAAPTIQSAKDRIARMPTDQALRIGLKGFGQCKILVDWVMGVKTYNVKTAPQSNVIGNGSVVVSIGSTQIAHGLVYRPEFATLLADVNRVFPVAAYAQYRGSNPEENAAKMFKDAVINDRCGAISNSVLPQVHPFEMKNFDAVAMKDKFKFYNSQNGLKCTTSVVSVPLFNAQTCQNEYKDVPLSDGVCMKFYNQFAKNKRVKVDNKDGGASSLPPVQLNELTPALANEFAVLNLDDAVLATAEAALTKPRIYAKFDPTFLMVDTANLADANEALVGAKLKKYYEGLSASEKADLTIEPAYSGIINAVKDNSHVVAQVSAAQSYIQTHPALSSAALEAVVEAELAPIKPILPPKFSVKNISCAAMYAAPAQAQAASLAQ